MNIVLTIHNYPDEWYQDIYICCECETEFMTNLESVPRFCPACGAKFDAVRIRYRNEEGNRTETVFLRDPQEKRENE